MRDSSDIEADESMRLLGVDHGNSLLAEDDLEDEEMNLPSSSSSLSSTKILAAAASVVAACAVVAFSGNSINGMGFPAMNFQAMPATTDGNNPSNPFILSSLTLLIS